MDTDKCKVLLKVIATGSMALTADETGYSHSGISRMISSMEQEAGFDLITRSRKGVQPTSECLELLPVIEQLALWGDRYSQMTSQICGLDIGTVRIGSPYRTYYPQLSKHIAAFHKAHPGITLEIINGNSSELSEAMRNHHIDLALISKREGDFQWIPLQQNPMVAWLPAEHPLSQASSFPIHAFEEEPFIDTCPNEDTDNHRVFAQNSINPNVRFATTDDYATYTMVEAGLGVSMNNELNSFGLTGTVVIKPLDPPQKIIIGMAYPSDKVLSPAARKFTAFVSANSFD